MKTFMIKFHLSYQIRHFLIAHRLRSQKLKQTFQESCNQTQVN
jgi:hypothetical protein